MKYFCFYDSDMPNREKRISFPSSKSKIDYIVKVLSQFEPVEIISCGSVLGVRSDGGHVEELFDNVYLRVLPSIGRKNSLVGKLSTLFSRVFLLFYMIFILKKNERIIVYHSLAYMRIVRWVKRIKKVKILLEVEEIYADVIGDEKLRTEEMMSLQSADAYLFPTQLLSCEINTLNKPEVIIHGTYQVEPNRNCNVFSDGSKSNCNDVVHCIYAGTLDPRKGGAAAAVAAAEFLPAHYHIHILGFGSNNEISFIENEITRVMEKTEAKVTYNGVLSGEDYIRFIQSCDIGLSTQNPNASFNSTSFPSKILSYMSNGLNVVSAKIPVVEFSAVGNMVYYYDDQSPMEIAKAVLSVDLDNRNNIREEIVKLDDLFKKQIFELLCM